MGQNMNEVIVKNNINIENLIYEIRGVQVMLNSDLAKLYECANGTKIINLAVKRNIERFPQDFYFQLTNKEVLNLQSQVGTTKYSKMSRALPYVFTEQGVAMLTTIMFQLTDEEIKNFQGFKLKPWTKEGLTLNTYLCLLNKENLCLKQY